jgi:hypothetical protein
MRRKGTKKNMFSFANALDLHYFCSENTVIF